jgi:hypothetical protein
VLHKFDAAPALGIYFDAAAAAPAPTLLHTESNLFSEKQKLTLGFNLI